MTFSISLRIVPKKSLIAVQISVILVLTASRTAKIEVFISPHAVSIPVFIALMRLSRLFLIAFHLSEIAVAMAVITLPKNDFIPFHIVVTVELMAVRTVLITAVIAFQTVVISVCIAVRAVEIVVLIAFHTDSTIPLQFSQINWKGTNNNCPAAENNSLINIMPTCTMFLMASQTDDRLSLIAVQIVVKIVFIALKPAVIAVLIALKTVVTTVFKTVQTPVKNAVMPFQIA